MAPRSTLLFCERHTSEERAAPRGEELDQHFLKQSKKRAVLIEQHHYGSYYFLLMFFYYFILIVCITWF